MPIKIQLPVCPLSINQAFQGRRFMTRKCKLFCRDVLLLLPKLKVGGYVTIKYIFYLRYWKLSDIDNLVKVLQDCLVKKKIIDDDRYIMRMEVLKVPAKTDSIEIEIEQYK